MVDFSVLDFHLTSVQEMVQILGSNDKHLKLLAQLYQIELYSDSGQIMTSSHDPRLINELERIFKLLKLLVKRNIAFNERDINYIHNLIPHVNEEEIIDLFINRKEIIKTFAGKPIYAKTINQKKYMEMIDRNTLIFGIGPAGTGKTYLAVLNGIKKLREGTVKQIILTRPAVEAGENLGFLPGDLMEKVDPYIRPFYDALYEILGLKQTEELIAKGIIEIAPLAYMRGRTLENAYVILDEAQNTTPNQMKLFLTRLGFGSKMIVTGDITQSDLPKSVESGLVKAARVLTQIPDIDILYFDTIDVVRHPLVQTILKRFDHVEN
jgi:phosphate starvation-inducible PhoH-like protein